MFCQANGGQAGPPGFKADPDGSPSARAKEKAGIKGRENGDKANGHRYLKDMIRASVRFGSCAAMRAALDAAAKHFTVVEAKDHVRHPKPGGYIDYNLIVRNPNNGHLCELQFHFDLMIEAKHHGGHGAYKKERAASGGQRIRHMTDRKARGHVMRAVHKGQHAYRNARVEIAQDPNRRAMYEAFSKLECIAMKNGAGFGR
jgi:hypothetical protein